MKNNSLTLAGAALCSLFITSLPAFAQGTAFTYQGRLDQNGAPASGLYDLRFKLFVDPFGNTQTGSAVVSNAVSVASGLFTVSLDFGAGIFNGSNFWLEVDVKTNDAAVYVNLNPLQALTPAPYAIFAANSGGGGLAAGTYGSAVTFSNAADQFTGTFTGNGINLSNVNAATLDGLSAANFWKISGNSGTSPTNGNFLGTTDDQPLELWVNQSRALRLEPGTNSFSAVGAPNVIGGAPNNFVDGGVVGATIAGGGALVMTGFLPGPSSNHVSAIFGTIGGGRLNTVGADHSTIAGGVGNTIQTGAYDSTIGGGQFNLLGSGARGAAIGGGYNNTANGSSGTVGGGYNNNANGLASTVGGGGLNSASGQYAAVGGGYFNSAGAGFATVSGGLFNSAGSDATIGGGSSNIADGQSATIGGGVSNNAASQFATIGGGYLNSASGNSATVAGGTNNAASGFAATVPGGYSNTAAGAYSFAAGARAKANHDGAFVWSDSSDSAGFFSTASNHSDSAGFSSTTSNQFSARATGGVRFVTAGAGISVDGQPVPLPQLTANDANHSNIVNVVNGSPANFVGAGAIGATIGGGGAGNFFGFAYPNSVSSDFGTVSGGRENAIQTNSPASVIGGGLLNAIQANVFHATIGGGSENTIQSFTYGSTIAGGGGNTIEIGAYDSTIGGGSANTIQSNAYWATIGGGDLNSIETNASNSTIGGGFSNIVRTNAQYATIPGGYGNRAAGRYSFAAGNQAQANHDGAFVWADSTDADFTSTSSNQFLIRASGGVGINTNNPAGAALNVAGTVVAGTVSATSFQGDGSGLFNVSSGALGNYVFAYNNGEQSVATRNVFQDATFATDAQINGWMHVPGTAQYTNAQTGLYLIQYNAEVSTASGNGTNAQLRATLNGAEIPGSRSAVTLSALNQLIAVSKSMVASVNPADVLTVQFTGSGTGIRLTSTANSTLTITRIQ